MLRGRRSWDTLSRAMQAPVAPVARQAAALAGKEPPPAAGHQHAADDAAEEGPKIGVAAVVEQQPSQIAPSAAAPPIANRIEAANPAMLASLLQGELGSDVAVALRLNGLWMADTHPCEFER